MIFWRGGAAHHAPPLPMMWVASVLERIHALAEIIAKTLWHGADAVRQQFVDDTGNTDWLSLLNGLNAGPAYFFRLLPQDFRQAIGLITRMHDIVNWCK